MSDKMTKAERRDMVGFLRRSGLEGSDPDGNASVHRGCSGSVSASIFSASNSLAKTRKAESKLSTHSEWDAEDDYISAWAYQNLALHRTSINPPSEWLMFGRFSAKGRPCRKGLCQCKIPFRPGNPLQLPGDVSAELLNSRSGETTSQDGVISRDATSSGSEPLLLLDKARDSTGSRCRAASLPGVSVIERRRLESVSNADDSNGLRYVTKVLEYTTASWSGSADLIGVGIDVTGVGKGEDMLGEHGIHIANRI
ncbi:hypothetical protein BDK51DRAFT_47623 [Blyttiomyces helicus]|uniref:Uncharacterized protein n=1 Tax=Blyttiomyces helicus TaxID=388810 RepID=A0A4P9WHP8_9FUNG|nr:hypothetical protein BDK51DRAFT_47623 [Blyttiomyces helicus]|eukprot:RKO92359.1 hypothetical protein BDK51DRAFT_47623 [Blyttiomyces helicus]